MGRWKDCRRSGSDLVPFPLQPPNVEARYVPFGCGMEISGYDCARRLYISDLKIALR